MAETKLSPEECATAYERYRTGKATVRALSAELGVNQGVLSRRFKRLRKAADEERRTRLQAQADRVNERKRFRRRGFEPNPDAIQSMDELRELAAQADTVDDDGVPEEAKIVAPLRPGERDEGMSIGLVGAHAPDGIVTPIWNYPAYGQVVLAADYAALYSICRSDTRAHWFIQSAIHAGELLPGEPRQNGELNNQRRVRFPDGSRRRAYLFVGSHERLHLVRLYRALLYDSRNPEETGIHPPPLDEHGRIGGIYLV
jgi:transposase-like protein